MCLKFLVRQFQILSETAPELIWTYREEHIWNIARRHITYALDFNRCAYRTYEELF